MHDIVNVVGPESATVAAPPERVFCEKFPSGELSVHDDTFFALQKIVVREPSFTLAGMAQISTWAFGPVYTGFVVVLCVGVDVKDVGGGVPVLVVVTSTLGASVGVSVPTL